MSEEYYYLKKGDTIQEGDEADLCNDGWRDEPKWVMVTQRIGMPAPDPKYVSHTKFRRRIYKH